MDTIDRRPELRLLKPATAVTLASLLALTGCSAIQVKMGWRVALAKTPVASIEATLPNNPGIAPGEKSPLVVTVMEPTGQVLTTTGKGKGKVMWKDLTIAATVVSANKNGILTLPKDPRVSDGKTGHIEITVPSHPDVTTSLDIPLRYNIKFTSNYAGPTGSAGTNGLSGTDGMSGSPGSTDPDNPSAGGNGGNGTDGSNGGDGGDGGDGPAVQVSITFRTGDHPLLQAGVTSAGRKERYYLVDPNGGSLYVSSLGGAGGSGGRGGSGGAGGAGGSGSPNGSSGMNGSSGQNGSNGSSGRGGSISVTYDPQVKPYLSALHFTNPGGPAPTFAEQPVSPLW